MLSVACMSLVFFLRNLQPMLTRTSCKFTFRLRHGVHFQGQDKKKSCVSSNFKRDLNKSILKYNTSTFVSQRMFLSSTHALQF